MAGMAGEKSSSRDPPQYPKEAKSINPNQSFCLDRMGNSAEYPIFLPHLLCPVIPHRVCTPQLILILVLPPMRTLHRWRGHRRSPSSGRQDRGAGLHRHLRILALVDWRRPCPGAEHCVLHASSVVQDNTAPASSWAERERVCVRALSVASRRRASAIRRQAILGLGESRRFMHTEHARVAPWPFLGSAAQPGPSSLSHRTTATERSGGGGGNASARKKRGQNA